MNNPQTGDKSGYYRIGTQWTYCNMTAVATGFLPICAGIEGEWRRIVNIDISAGGDCPSGWNKDTYSGVSFCRVVSDNHYSSSSAIFSTNGTSYQRVCGRARGYQKGYAASFWGYHRRGFNIDGNYADGLLITYGKPRNHIWSYINGEYENVTSSLNCPCASSSGYTAPPFLDTNYYCETGNVHIRNMSAYYFDDPLWDESGCITSRCCDNITQPWFYRELNVTT